MVYVPMSYLYALRYQPEETDLVLSLRQVSQASSFVAELTYISQPLGNVYRKLL